MTIKVLCPVCKANNELTVSLKSCRRCREDLSLLYAAKGYSYKYRILGVQFLAQQRLQQGANLLQIAADLDKSI